MRTDENKIEKYANLSSPLIVAIKDQSPGDIIQSIFQLAQVVYTDMPAGKKYQQVRLLSWTSHALLQNDNNFRLENFYEKSQSYADVPKVAFCALETLSQLLDQSVNSHNEPQAQLFLQGEPGKPSLLKLIQLQTSQDKLSRKKKKLAAHLDKKFLGATNTLRGWAGASSSPGLAGQIDPFWKVRHQAIKYLDAFSRSNPASQDPIFTLLAQQLCVEKVKPVQNLLQHLYTTDYSNHSTWNTILDKHQKHIEDEKKKHETHINSGQKLIRKLKGKNANESNADEIPEEAIVLNEDDKLQLIELELNKEMLSVEQDKLDNLF